MRVRWNQIDPAVARRVTAQVAAAEEAQVTAQKRQEQTAQSVAAPRPRPLGLEGAAVAAFSAVAVVGLYVNVCFNLSGPWTTLALTLLPVGLITAAASPQSLFRARSGGAPGAVRGFFLPAEDSRVKEAFASGAQTRAEKLYGEIVLLLAEAQTASFAEGRTQSDILRQCNELLRDSVRVEEQRRRLSKALRGGVALADTEAEYNALAKRHESEADEMARHSLAESLSLCRERMQSLEAMTALRARLEAHGEAVCQAMLLLRAALLRRQATSLLFGATAIADLRQTVRRLNNQTEAIEEAAREMRDI